MHSALNAFQTRRVHPSPVARILLAFALLTVSSAFRAAADPSFADQLKSLPFKIAYESYVDHNWEIFVINADGSNPVNLTKTANVHEHYPQISPDGTKICFSVDEGESRQAVRSLWVMDIDGKNRKQLTDHAREPFWSPDSKTIGFLPQEFPKFNVIDFYTDGMSFYDLSTGKIQPHANSTNLHHLYNPSWARNGKWIVSTVHAGMGFDHTILLIEAHGTNVINLKIPGCRPCFSPDGKQLAWGSGDHELAVGAIDLDSPQPTISSWRNRVEDKSKKIYHVDWSPDSRYLCFSRGPDGQGDPNQPGTFQSACEIVGVHAAGWDLCAVSAEREGMIKLDDPAETGFTMLTANGCSNKEPTWFRVRP